MPWTFFVSKLICKITLFYMYYLLNRNRKGIPHLANNPFFAWHLLAILNMFYDYIKPRDFLFDLTLFMCFQAPAVSILSTIVNLLQSSLPCLELAVHSSLLSLAGHIYTGILNKNDKGLIIFNVSRFWKK